MLQHAVGIDAVLVLAGAQRPFELVVILTHQHLHDVANVADRVRQALGEEEDRAGRHVGMDDQRHLLAGDLVPVAADDHARRDRVGLRVDVRVELEQRRATVADDLLGDVDQLLRADVDLRRRQAEAVVEPHEGLLEFDDAARAVAGQRRTSAGRAGRLNGDVGVRAGLEGLDQQAVEVERAGRAVRRGERRGELCGAVGGRGDHDRVDRGDAVESLGAGCADEPRIADSAIDRGHGCRNGRGRSSRRNGRARRLLRRTAAEGVGRTVRVRARNLAGNDSGRRVEILADRAVVGSDDIEVGLQAERHADHGPGRRRQRAARCCRGKRRSRGRAQRDRGIAAEDEALFLDHRRLQRRFDGEGLHVLVVLGRIASLEGDAVFQPEAAERREILALRMGDHATALTFGDTGALVADVDVGDRFPVRLDRVAATDARDAVAQRGQDGEELFRRRFEVVGLQASRGAGRLDEGLDQVVRLGLRSFEERKGFFGGVAAHERVLQTKKPRSMTGP